MRRSLLCLTATVAACAGTPYVVTNGYRDGRAERTHYSTLVRAFETEATCTTGDEISVTPLEVGLFHAEGCAHEADFVFTCGARGVWNNTCWWTHLADLHAMAEVDMGCPADSIDVRIVEPRERVTSGCGRTERYLLTCRDPDSSDETCEWINPRMSPTVPLPDRAESTSPYVR
jgi:hypothetical protein